MALCVPYRNRDPDLHCQTDIIILKNSTVLLKIPRIAFRNFSEFGQKNRYFATLVEVVLRIYYILPFKQMMKTESSVREE